MNNTNCAWIHLENLKFFLYLGATPEEQSIGQNITIHLSLLIPYCNTNDELSHTVDYGKVYDVLCKKIEQMHKVQLLEYFVEQILNELQTQFSKIHAVKIVVQKGYIPLKNFSGTSKIEAYKQFIF